MGILIKDALVIPMDEEGPDFFEGNILVEGDEICEIDPEQASLGSRGKDMRVIDGSNLILMPGLVNTHGHAAMSLFRGFADDMPLKEWLEDKIWPLENNLKGDDVYWGTLLSITEMIRGGVTTFTDMYFFMERAAEAVAESKMRAVLSRGLVGLSENSGGALEDSRELIRGWHGAEDGRITITLGPHAPYTCPPDFLRRVMDAAGETGRPMQIHLAETAGEVENCLAEHSCTPVKFLENLKFFDYPVTAAHCVHLTGDDIAILADKEVKVSHNPGSNLKLGSGIAPLHEMLKAGITVGLGTDGAASNNNLDLLEEMRLAALLAKGSTMDPTAVPARKALNMATRDGARALFLPRLGMIKKGYKADLIGLRKDAPHMTPMHDPLAQVVYAASSGDVDLVMVDGNILLEKGRLSGLDEEKIKAEAGSCARRLTGGDGQLRLPE